MTKKAFEFQIAQAKEGYRMFDYERQEHYMIPYEELKKDKKLLAKLLHKEMHRFTHAWNNSIVFEELLKNLTQVALESGVEVKPINELIANTINIKQEDES